MSRRYYGTDMPRSTGPHPDPLSDAYAEIARIQAENARPVPAAILDDQGWCCGRKPHPYKRPSPHACCLRCGRHYDSAGSQIPSFFWQQIDADTFVMGETSQKAKANDAARRLGLPFPFGGPRP